MSDQHVKTIQTVYAAFGRGDVAGVLEHMAEDVEFSFNSAKPAFPWHGTFRGKAALPGFFEALGTGTRVTAFEPGEAVHSGAHVVVPVRFEHELVANGRRLVERQLHWWTFAPSGKVARLVHFTDTAAVAEAARA